MREPGIIVRPAVRADLPAIAALFEQENGRAPNHAYIGDCLENYPSAVAEDGDVIAGFIYCNRFAPDILEIANLMVGETVRGTGLGTGLLEEVEQQARGKWASLILVNSTLYEHPPRPSPAGFYLKRGFALIHQTAATAVHAKAL